MMVLEAPAKIAQALSYPDTPDGRRDQDADATLLRRLDWQARGVVSLASVAESLLLDTVESVAREFPGWRLGGSDEQPLVERLDAHFRGPMEAWAAQQSARQAMVQRRIEEQRERDRQFAAALRHDRIVALRAELAALEAEQD